MKVMVLVLGDYVEVSKYVEGVPFPHEEYVLKNKGDLFNIKYRDGEGKFKLEVEGDDIETKDIGDLNKVNKDTKVMSMNILFGTNGCRRRSDNDVIGLYGHNSGVTMYLEEGMEGLEVDIYYNYFNKSQEYGEDTYLLYIIDNTSSDTNTLNNIEYLVNKINCETVVYTTSPREDFKKMKDNFKSIDLNLEVNDI